MGDQRNYRRTQKPSPLYRHANPYLNYLIEFMKLKKNARTGSKQLFIKAGAHWKRMSVVQREPYVSAATENRNQNRARAVGPGRVPPRIPLRPSKRVRVKCSRCGHRSGSPIKPRATPQPRRRVRVNNKGRGKQRGSYESGTRIKNGGVRKRGRNRGAKTKRNVTRRRNTIRRATPENMSFGSSFTQVFNTDSLVSTVSSY